MRCPDPRGLAQRRGEQSTLNQRGAQKSDLHLNPAGKVRAWRRVRAWRLPAGARQAPFIGARPATPSCHPSRRRLGQIPNPEGFERRLLSVFPCGIQRQCPGFCASKVRLRAVEAARAGYLGSRAAALNPPPIRQGFAHRTPAAPGLNLVFGRAPLETSRTNRPATYHELYRSTYPPLYTRLIMSCFLGA